MEQLTKKQQIDNLVREIQNAEQTARIIREDLPNKAEKIYKKISEELKKNGTYNTLQKDYVYVPVDNHRYYKIHLLEGIISIKNNGYRKSDALIQINIYKALSTLEDELRDYQLDLFQIEKVDDWKSRNKLNEIITDRFFEELLEKGEFNFLPGRTLKMNKGLRGRYNFTDETDLTKSYFENEVKAKLSYYAGQYATHFINQYE